MTVNAKNIRAGVAGLFTIVTDGFLPVVTYGVYFSEPVLIKKKNRTPIPHDATFRQFMPRPDVARDFMELHLSAKLRAICDLSTLKLESGSFVEDDLRQYFQRRAL